MQAVMFAVGLLATVVATGLTSAAAINIPEEKPSSLNRLTNAHACQPLAGSKGSAQFTYDGVTNMSSTNRLTVSCPLTSPEEGFAPSTMAGALVRDSSWGGDVTVRTCYTVLGFGAGCTYSAISGEVGVGPVFVPLPVGPFGSYQAWSLQVSLPRIDYEGGPSAVMAYGYDYQPVRVYEWSEDMYSFDSRVSSMQSSLSSHGAALDVLNDNVVDLDNRIWAIEDNTNMVY
jgi:hypothetical protein